MTLALMLASFGLEIVECGGALVYTPRPTTKSSPPCCLRLPESKPQITAARALASSKWNSWTS